METKAIGGVRVMVASPRTLYDLKKGTLRAIDQQDSEALRRLFDLGDA